METNCSNPRNVEVFSNSNLRYEITHTALDWNFNKQVSYINMMLVFCQLVRLLYFCGQGQLLVNICRLELEFTRKPNVKDGNSFESYKKSEIISFYEYSRVIIYFNCGANEKSKQRKNYI